MGNDWVPESQVTKNNCASLGVDRFFSPQYYFGRFNIAAAPPQPPPRRSSPVFTDRSALSSEQLY